MARVLLIAPVATFTATAAAAQDQTLIGDEATHGGFGGPVMRLTRIAGTGAVFMGGRGGMIVNGTCVIGSSSLPPASHTVTSAV